MLRWVIGSSLKIRILVIAVVVATAVSGMAVVRDLRIGVASQSAPPKAGIPVESSAAAVRVFQRIATFEAIDNDPGADRTDERVAEIVDATADGRTLVYTDSQGGQIGLLDIDDPANPTGLGVFPVGGEPTSVAIAGPYALVAVNTSRSFTEPSGDLVVVDISDPTRPFEVARLDMGGQPDSVAVSPDGRYAAAAIENERNDDLEDPRLTPRKGGLPQLPAGFLNVVHMAGEPAGWTVRRVDLAGLGDFAPGDPEPEFVAINTRNIAAVTLQENNHIVLVDLRRGQVVRHFSAGTVTLEDVDILENGLIEPTGTLENVAREPDAVAWIDDQTLATANEGDLFGGSRGFTIFDHGGGATFESGAAFDRLTARLGHYPEHRSENRGSEPEGIAFATYGDRRMLFVGAERSGLVAVYELDHPSNNPKLLQVLPTGIGPEGLKAIPARGLFVVAAEVDDPPRRKKKNTNRRSGVRSAISIYRLQAGPARYPTIISADAAARAGRGGDGRTGLPIPFGALSALAADRTDPDTLFAVHDSSFNRSRIYKVDVSRHPAVIVDEIVLKKNGVPVDRDLEGLVQRTDGSFWAVSEGRGRAKGRARKITSRNLLMEIAADGTVLKEVGLPREVDALRRPSGFEGVAVIGSGAHERVYVAFQREWAGDPRGRVRIGVFDPNDGAWRFFHYPIEPRPGFSNAAVGLSEIVHLGDGRFAVIERDNLVGAEAAIKRLYTFRTAGLEPQPQGRAFPLLTKKLARDILADLRAPNGSVLGKPEGLAVGADGQVYLVTDNDAAKGAPGETQFQNLGNAEDLFGQGAGR